MSSLLDINAIATLANAANFVEQVTNQFVVKPYGSVGISGFLFDIYEDDDVVLQSEVTDHYVEDNTAVQDHIALRPERFTLRGYVSELNDKTPSGVQTLQEVLDRLTTIAAMVPQLATQALQLYNSISGGFTSVSDSINNVSSLYGLFIRAISNNTRQQAAYNYFYSLWLARQLVTVETPWNVFDNMAIESVRAVQHGNTNLITDFSVTFKKIRVAQTAINIGVSTVQFSSRFWNLISPIMQQAKTNGLANNPSTGLPWDASLELADNKSVGTEMAA